MGENISEADELIKGHTKVTPLRYAPNLATLFGKNIWLKLENEQLTGSFKIRGTVAKMLELREKLGDKFNETTFVTSSTGNRGLALAYCAHKFGTKAIIYVPENTSESKIKAMKEYGAEVRILGKTVEESEEEAIKQGEKSGYLFLTSHDDPLVVSSYGTIGKEIMGQIERLDKELDVIIAPVGGGGLVSGIAAYIKGSEYPSTRIIGVEPEGASAMYKSLVANKIVALDEVNTIAEGAALRKPTEMSFEMFKALVDATTTVTEEDIKRAIYLLEKEENVIAEGAGALPLAILLSRSGYFDNVKNIVLVVSGGNINKEVLDGIIQEQRYGKDYISQTYRWLNLSNTAQRLASNEGVGDGEQDKPTRKIIISAKMPDTVLEGGDKIEIGDKQFEILEHLDKSSYKAKDLKGKRRVVLKFQYRDKEYPKYEKDFFEQIPRHSNIIRGYPLMDESGNILIVTDFIEGETLQDYLLGLDIEHKSYFSELFPEILEKFIGAVKGVKHIVKHGFYHEFASYHIWVDKRSGRHILFDFDLPAYEIARFQTVKDIEDEIIFDIGITLCEIVGMGTIYHYDELVDDKEISFEKLGITDSDFTKSDAYVDLQKLYSYIPDGLNQILKRFAEHNPNPYTTIAELHSDLEIVLRHIKSKGTKFTSNEGVGGEKNTTQEKVTVTFREMDRLASKEGIEKMISAEDWRKRKSPFINYSYDPSQWAFETEEALAKAIGISKLSSSKLIERLQARLTESTPDLSKIDAYHFNHELGTVIGVLQLNAQMLAIQDDSLRGRGIADIKDSLDSLMLWREWIYRHQDSNPRIESHYLFTSKPIDTGKTILEGIAFLPQEVNINVREAIYPAKDKLASNQRITQKSSSEKKTFREARLETEQEIQGLLGSGFRIEVTENVSDEDDLDPAILELWADFIKFGGIDRSYLQRIVISWWDPRQIATHLDGGIVEIGDGIFTVFGEYFKGKKTILINTEGSVVSPTFVGIHELTEVIFAKFIKREYRFFNPAQKEYLVDYLAWRILQELQFFDVSQYRLSVMDRIVENGGQIWWTKTVKGKWLKALQIELWVNLNYTIFRPLLVSYPNS